MARRGGRYIRRRRAPRRLKRYVHNAITSRLPAKQHSSSWSVSNVTPGTFFVHQVGQAIVKGTDRGDRIGDSIDLKGIKLRCHLRNTATTVLDYPTIRLMLFRNREPHISTTLNMFKGGNVAGVFTPDDYVTTGDFDQIYKPLNRRKLAVIMDKKIKIMPAVTSGNDTDLKFNRNFNIWIPLKARIKYNPEADAGGFDFLKPNYQICWYIEKNDSTTTASGLTVKINQETFYRG